MTRSILLVEDDPADELLILRVLEKHHIANKVQVVRDGQEALDFLFCEGAWSDRDATDVPQAVLLDLKLPKLNGHEVLAAIRASDRYAAMPVIVMTSSSEESDIVKSYGLGANSYVRKPVDFDQFSEAVRQLGLYWLVLNEPLPQE